jgi:hypothetical protein
MGLFNSTVLDVAIGLVFVYLLLSIFCTTVNEWIAGILQARAKTLQEGIRGLLDNQPFKDATFLADFYKHPVIAGMVRDTGHPSYLSSRAFATAIVDLVAPAVQGPLTLDDLVRGVKDLPEGDVKKSLLALVADAQGDLDKAKKNIETWFDDTMDRVSGWYKRWAQKWTIGLAVCITLAANADTLNIAHRLWTDPVLRSAVSEEAKQRAQMPRPTATVEYQDPNDPFRPAVIAVPANQLTEAEDILLGRVVGWSRASFDVGALTWFQRILGWILTSIAVSLGAPFWFDTLNRFINIRSAGKPPEKSQSRG